MEIEFDELKKLEAKPVVFAPVGKPFEAMNASEFVPGPYYADAEEVMPELAQPKESTDPQKDYSVDRRDFMRLFSIATMTSASACVRRPVEKAIPYVKQPIGQTPGVPVHYASTCTACASGCGIVVKTREGRPVKIEGSQDHPLSQGSTCGLGQAQLQGLYHPERLKGPFAKYGNKVEQTNWDSLYEMLGKKVGTAKNIGILTRGSTGHRKGFFHKVLKTLGSKESNLFTFESNALFASMAKANELAFGQSGIPRVEFAKAEFILGIGSDFQDNGISPVYQTKGFSFSHSVRKNKKGAFVQFETNFSLTGGMADKRYPIPAGQELLVSLLVLKALVDSAKGKNLEAVAQAKQILAQNPVLVANGYKTLDVAATEFEKIAVELFKRPSVIVGGGSSNFDENATKLQLAIVLANEIVGAYETTVINTKGWLASPVDSSDWQRFLEEAPKLDMLFIVETDPYFTLPKELGLDKIFKAIPSVISIQSFPQEVDQFAEFILPCHHFLESWGDEESVAGFWSTQQPAVRPLTDSRQSEDIFLWLLARANKSLPYEDYKAYLKEQWLDIYKNTSAVSVSSDVFFDAVLRRGFVGKLNTREATKLRSVVEYFSSLNIPLRGGFTLVAPLDHRLHDGRGAHLPVMQEIGDRLTTIAWDSWVSVNPNTMAKLGLKRNQLVEISSSFGKLKVAVFPLPGIHKDTLVIHRGNGHKDLRSTVSIENGVNPLDLLSNTFDPLSGQPVTALVAVELSPTKEFFHLAAMQKIHDIQNRKDIVKKVALDDMEHLPKIRNLDKVPDLFPDLPQGEYRWGMSVDLDKCNGCGACMVACTIENNVPQTGREQIIMGRQMHWIRLDRYFYGDFNNPTVTFQPVMCQHCNHAPCEAVCPVYATTHDPEGLNAMTYNRCVGTRYCANACPYKVRRFNWWTHRWGVMGRRLQDRNPRAVNPDVTVRTRGVMEKCSLCVGRIRDAKHHAKKEGRRVKEGEMKTACQQVCPTNAIVFGELSNPDSQVSKARSSSRAYLLLGGDPEHGHYGLKTLPNVNYLMKVTLQKEDKTAEHK